MAITVNVQEAKTRLSELLGRVERGEDVVIARAGKPIAHLVAIEPAPERQFGVMDLVVTDDFFLDLAEEELAAW